LFKELLAFIGYKIKEFVTSRLFPLALMVLVIFALLVVRLYKLQIIEGADAQQAYIEQKTLRTISLDSTRGNIYDRKGNLLAHNELVYSVTIQDTGEYNGYQRNLMIMRLLEILDHHKEEIIEELPLAIDEKGHISYTLSGDSLLRVLRDVYGKHSVQEVIDDEKCDENITAEGLFELLYNRYGIGKYGRTAGTYEISKKEALRVINVRYLLALYAYQRYRSVTVVKSISEDTKIEILEHNDELVGVAVEETYQRVYNNSIYFAHIIGYTGKASSEDLERLNGDAEEPRYQPGDIVGKTGIEASMEDELQGIKGSRTMYLDSLGRIMDVSEEVDPVTGNDIYLSIDSDLQMGTYHLIEQHLAGILVDKLVNDLVYNPAGTSASNRKLSIYEAYYQLINNNIIDLEKLEEAPEETASAQIREAFKKRQDEVYAMIRRELLSDEPTPYKDLGGDVPEDRENFVKIYFGYVYEVLKDNGYIIRANVDTNDEIYIAYRTDETISLNEFLRHALSENWIDVTKLDMDGKYTSAESTYAALVEKIEELLKQSGVFSKRIYKDLIYNKGISGCQVCSVLYEQGVLEADPLKEADLATGNDETAYDFMIERIENLEITPAQLAMDPCSAAVTIVDVNTGEVLACVSYPSYDNNKLSGAIDTAYYAQLVNDMSSPLYNTATQAQKAPGSVFKLVTTAAALESNAVEADEIITPEGVFTKLGLNLACSYYTTYHEPHNPMNIVDAIAQSCNYFFCEMGFRLSQNDGGTSNPTEENYNEMKGLNTLEQYATRLGLGTKTGIQLAENEPQITNTAPVPSAIGQGTNLFSNVQLARYLATLANRGTIYDLTLVDKILTKDGDVVMESKPVVEGKSELLPSTWDTIQEGMRAVTTKNSGTKKNISCKVEIAGKTGTAEENKLRPNHANFIAYAPYDAPEVGVAVTILNGYTASNSVKISSDVFDLYYGELTLEEILERGASKASETIILD
jgi:Cell division protein FtsI/penicillin-binding protein 2